MIPVDPFVDVCDLKVAEMTALLEARCELAAVDWARDIALAQLWTAEYRVKELWNAV